MICRAHGRLLTWLLWTLHYRSRLRRDLHFTDISSVQIGDRLTVFDEWGEPVRAEVLRFDHRGRATLVRDDDVLVERVLS